MYWKVRAKSNQLKLGDANTKYYHTCASIRRNRNIISAIKDVSNSILSHPKDIEECFTAAFKSRFLANASCRVDSDIDLELLSPIISEEDNEQLCATVTMTEVKEAVFDLAPDKASGPDGFTPFFYQKYWSLGAFVPERLIQDNILLAHEVFHSFKNKKGREGWVAIKLDMEKAYDRLEWSYVLACLRKLGFCEKWVSWVEQCITTVSFSVPVNGIPGDMFCPSRGIRQGDPLSPYIFILCAEMLARLLFQASIEAPKLIGVTLGHSRCNIPFLTFADDTMIFAKAKMESCTAIKSILEKYCLMSGNYLGCPLVSGKVTNSSFSLIQERVSAQLTKWRANSLSQAGRTVLIQSNLASKASFQMQSFSLPPHILSSLDKSYRNFLWNKDLESKAPNLIGWNKVCIPKKMSGLGLIKAKINNQALQLKLLWKLIRMPDNLWVKLVTQKYLKRETLFTYQPKTNVSWQWRKLMALRAPFKRGLRWIVGDGKAISFWDDNWVYESPISERCLPRPNFEHLKVSFFISDSGNWNFDLLRQFVPMNVVKDIGSIFLPSNRVEDKIVWGLTADGEYSVQSGARLLQEDAHHLFISCPYSQDVFAHTSELSTHASIPRMDNSSCFIEYVCNLKRVNSVKDISFIAIVWWFIWYARNNIIFRQHSISTGALGSMIKSFIHNWEQANKGLNLDSTTSSISNKVANKRPHRTNISWVLPPINYVKINFDGSKTIDGRTAYGFVIRDSEGNLLLSGASQIAQHQSVLVAEAWGLREGILACLFRVKNIIIEGDNMSVIRLLNEFGKSRGLSKLLLLILKKI
ncbi:uncharacterized protein LOC104897032 [Beta vulgaris subsp. vulgaris]|uniref:uncharacterized protein LOC104897032 n=1 Tax=Beta vulgaris subsp. vulgaris TaxID=3555 RepID=UPI0025475376|nr:uncharacterized protein LOC104897032 [Beta vulgaris subsp. vulgaris]